ncbi:MAG: alpha/beta fold hydrolase [Oscillochloridaceae bacterium umkhey_bin13]
MAEVLGFRSALYRTTLADLGRAMGRCGLGIYQNLATLLMALRSSDLRAEAVQVRCPVLVIAGSADPVVPVAQAHWLAAHLPNVELHALPGVGHVPQWEAAPSVEALLLRWLAAHPVGEGAGYQPEHRSPHSAA